MFVSPGWLVHATTPSSISFLRSIVATLCRLSQRIWDASFLASLSDKRKPLIKGHGGEGRMGWNQRSGFPDNYPQVPYKQEVFR